MRHRAFHVAVLAAGLALAANAGEVCQWARAMAAARSQSLTGDPDPTRAAAAAFEAYDSGPLPGDGPARRVSLDVTGVKTLRLQTRCEAGTANCNIWGEPELVAQDGSRTRLTTLKPASVRVGWGQLLVDQNWQQHPLAVGDRVFAFGFWVHADSELQFTLDGKYTRFECFVGEDRERANGIVRFRVNSGEPPQPPACWEEISRKFPAESGWMLDDAGKDSIAAWFAERTTPAIEQRMIERALAEPGNPACAATLRDEAAKLLENRVPPGDPRWLDLHARACRLRQCARWIGADSTLKHDLEAIVAEKASADDTRWPLLERKATFAAEIEDQFETLRFDLARRPSEQRAKETLRGESLVLPADRDPTDIVARRTVALFARLCTTAAAARLAPQTEALAGLRQRTTATPVTDEAARRALFREWCALRRVIAFANPLLDFDRLLFLKRHRAIYNHMCDQYYGICARPGGGLFVLEDPFGPHPRARDLLANSVCETGRLKGRQLAAVTARPPQLSWDGETALTGDDAGFGAFLSPALSPDAKQILFAYVECLGDKQQIFHEDPSRGHWDPRRCHHIFKVNVDGSGLQQLTDGSWNEFDPCWLPNGRVAFVSERRGGYLRCGRACPLYNLYDMNPDGSGINCLSFHDSNEWHPSVAHDGRIVWTRWDYVDRHGCIAHMPWTISLDGRDPRALHGNFAPRPGRPDMELNVRPIPGSGKYVATAAPHHGQAFGSLVVIDPQVADDDAMGPVKRLTPDVGFPESQDGFEAYGTAWPLSEDFHLCVYDSAIARGGSRDGRGDYGIYLVDSFGNKELVYRDPEISCLSPMPLRPVTLPTPPAMLADAAAKPVSILEKGEATMAVVNVYDSMMPWPAGTRIKELRVLQLLPCAVPSGRAVHHETGKRVAEAGDSIVPCRRVLGTVPVEADGSAHFTVPAYRELFFQAVDERGMAITSMRSGTHARAGERLVCAGCHEDKSRAPVVPATTPLAMRREPSRPKPDVDGSNPFSYPRLVQPVLDRNCVQCHEQKKDEKAPSLAREPVANRFYASYHNLMPFSFTAYGDGYRTLPGRFGARASKLIQLLEKGHHDVKLSDEDFHRLTLWQDCMSMFYGVFEQEPAEAQLRGEVADAILE